MIVGIFIFGILVLSVIIILSHPAFGRTPRGERQERIEHSPNYKDGQFVGNPADGLFGIQDTFTSSSQQHLPGT